jgi:predicted regulator of Ras-like GTPase activity (Roadblock/LC7/MglB family)
VSSAFGDILARMIESLPGARGAIFVDWEGETVAEAPGVGNDDLRILAAHWAIVYYQTRTVFGKHGLGVPEELVLRFPNRAIVLRMVTEEYLVLLALGEQPNLGRALHLLQRAGQQLKEEM